MSCTRCDCTCLVTSSGDALFFMSLCSSKISKEVEGICKEEVYEKPLVQGFEELERSEQQAKSPDEIFDSQCDKKVCERKGEEQS